jgi:uncharacterized protein YndB with AHSA1/START domain
MNMTSAAILAPAAAIALAAAIAGAARAEVVEADAGGFTVREKVDIAASPQVVWAALGHPGDWWSSEHTYSQDAHNLSVRLETGGCWCEALPGGGAVRHMVVVNVQPERTLRLVGALGPLQALGVAGAMTFTLKGEGGHTALTWTYDVGGHAVGGLDKLAGPVDGVLNEQAHRLEAYAEAPPR